MEIIVFLQIIDDMGRAAARSDRKISRHGSFRNIIVSELASTQNADSLDLHCKTD